MTNHAELSRDLALALGYAPDSVGIARINTMGERCEVWRITHSTPAWQSEGWVAFDYRDPTVCLPLIEWLMRKHDCSLQYSGNRFGIWLNSQSVALSYCAIFPEAVARAVIAVKGKS